MAHIFVYGTLKRGQPNHRVMLDQTHGSAAFQGRGCTVESFPLVIAGKYNIPWLLHLPGQGHRVAGEIYKVDQQMLHFLDDFEGCPNMYQRRALQVQVLEWAGAGGPGDSLQCFVYSTATYEPEWLHLPYHKNYDSEGPHGLRYNPRESSKEENGFQELQKQMQLLAEHRGSPLGAHSPFNIMEDRSRLQQAQKHQLILAPFPSLETCFTRQKGKDGSQLCRGPWECAADDSQYFTGPPTTRVTVEESQSPRRSPLYGIQDTAPLDKV